MTHKSMPTKPLIAYYGGKQRISSRIVDLLPRHTVYVEPFAGGAAVFFRKPWPPVTNNDHYREVLNDLSGDLVNLYRVVADPKLGPQLVHRLQCTLYSRECHETARHILRSGDGHPLDRAWAYYVLVQMSFSNALRGGWGTGVLGSNNAAVWVNKIRGLPEYLDRMCGVYIEHDDALDVIQRWDSPQTLFYCDPPYVGSDQRHYRGYTQDNLDSLTAALEACSGSFVLSGYDNNSYPDHWERFEIQTKCSASGRGKAGKGRDKSRAATATELGDRRRTEVLLRVDRSATARTRVQKIWETWEAKGFSFGKRTATQRRLFGPVK